jgi:hypothetical protein
MPNTGGAEKGIDPMPYENQQKVAVPVLMNSLLIPDRSAGNA